MAKKPTRRTTRAAGRKPRAKTSTTTVDTTQPKRKPTPGSPVSPKRKRQMASPRPTAIKARRKVETSDALLFPSGRPIRKR
jgi:hypothetical protein